MGGKYTTFKEKQVVFKKKTTEEINKILLKKELGIDFRLKPT